MFHAVRIGVLTGGGDCPGLNAVIRAIVRKGIDRYGHAIVGFRDGWRGPLENAHDELTIESTRGILPRGGTDLPFGFDTAVQVATEAIDRLHTTAESHNRVMVVEVMGRHAGWIALHAGLAGGA